MPAGVVEGSQPTVPVAGEDQAFIADRYDEIVPCLAQVRCASDADPVAIPDSLELARVLDRVVVPRGRKGRGRVIQKGHYRMRGSPTPGCALIMPQSMSRESRHVEFTWFHSTRW